ncbi:MAG TPA: hypothetical protein VKG79_06645, partial [Bryobacteraceae bacterium]|nr:hypothetical protein [Bryobacteraceae bacterium]
MSKCFSGSGFGDDESIDKNRPKINNPLSIAPTSIRNFPPSAVLDCNWNAAVAEVCERESSVDFDFATYPANVTTRNP